MRFYLNFKSEDLLIYSIVTFALFYPLFVVILILCEDNKKKAKYKETMLPLINVALGRENCKKVHQMKDMLDATVNPRDVEHICYKSKNFKMEYEFFQIRLGKDKDRIAYTAVLKKDNEKVTLSIKAVSEDDCVKIVSVNLN